MRPWSCPSGWESILGTIAGDDTIFLALTEGVTASVLADDGKVVFTTTDERKSEELAGAKRGGFGYTANVPLKELAPGRYVLRVEAQSSLGGAEPVRREVEFRVRP